MCDFCDRLRTASAKPFSFHRPTTQTEKVFVGPDAERLQAGFERVYARALANSLMTAVVGPPGTGKTQFLYHLRYLSRSADWRGGVVLLELKDLEVSFDRVVRGIFLSAEFEAFAKRYGAGPIGTPAVDPQLVAKRIGEIVQAARKASSGAPPGLVLGVDAVDEYVRKVAVAKKADPKSVMDALLGSFRLLLDSIPSLCIAFAVTEDAYVVMKSSLQDPSLGRRFLPLVDEDGEPVFLKETAGIPDEEATDLVHAFMSTWARANAYDLPTSPPFVNGRGQSIAPFTSEAVDLLRQACGIKGDLSMACILLIEDKLTRGHPYEPTLAITSSDAAWVLRSYSSYFSRFDLVEEQVRAMLGELRRDQVLGQFQRRARLLYETPYPQVISAFEAAVVAAGAGRAVPGGRFRFLRPRFSKPDEFQVVDLVVEAGSGRTPKRVAIEFADYRGRDSTGKALSTALRSGLADAGIIVRFTDSAERTYAKERGVLEIRDTAGSLDFATKVGQITMPAGFAWSLVGLQRDLAANAAEFQDFTKHLLGKFELDRFFLSLANAKPLDLEEERARAREARKRVGAWEAPDTNPAGWLQDFFR